jgi:hypothetical protein
MSRGMAKEGLQEMERNNARAAVDEERLIEDIEVIR